MNDAILAAAEAIHGADALFISAGAGMSVDSGLPDFRSKEGLWQQYPVIKDTKLEALDLASAKLWRDDPERVWAFYGHRFELYRNTTPHEGYQTLKRWIESKPEPSFILTTNVDGHFEKAGFAPEDIFEVHGSIHHTQCSAPCRETIMPLEHLPFTVNAPQLTIQGPLPVCPQCKSLLRPNILMIGDAYWLSNRADQQQQNFEDWEDELIGANIVSLEIGAGTHIPTARHYAEDIIGTTIRINRDEACPGRDIIPIQMTALEALTQIDSILNSSSN